MKNENKDLLLIGLVAIILIPYLVINEGERIKIRPEVDILIENIAILRDAYVNHTHYYNGKPKGHIHDPSNL